MGSPTRREFIGAATALAGGARLSAKPARKPNLIYVFADQLRHQSCGYGGDEYARTPNIDRLAGESFSFRNAISSTPVCSAYRATLLTGKYCSSTGMAINELRMSPEHECIGHVLTRGGYQTGYIGKWHLWANQLGHHDEAINGFVPPGPYRMGFDGYWAAYNFNHEYYNSPYFRNTPTREIHKIYEPDSQTNMAIEYIRQAAAKPDPFALFLSWGPPHDPWNPENVPPDYAEKFRNVNFVKPPNYSTQPDPYADNWARPAKNYDSMWNDYKRAYYAQASSVDADLGRLMKALEEQGLADNTIVAFSSDHGEMFGAHGRRAKLIFYEEALRIPFLIRWPKHIRPGQSADTCFASPDIMPTVLSMMGLPVPKTVEGTDLSGIPLGTSRSEPDAAYMQGMGTTAGWQDGTEWRGVRDKQYTYGIYHRDRHELLFDRKADPYEMKNLAEDRAHAATLAHYREKLQKFMREHNDTFESCTWYRDHWTDNRNIIKTATGVGQNLKTLDGVIRKYFPAGDVKTDSNNR